MRFALIVMLCFGILPMTAWSQTVSGLNVPPHNLPATSSGGGVCTVVIPSGGDFGSYCANKYLPNNCYGNGGMISDPCCKGVNFNQCGPGSVQPVTDPRYSECQTMLVNQQNAQNQVTASCNAMGAPSTNLSSCMNYAKQCLNSQTTAGTGPCAQMNNQQRASWLQTAVSNEKSNYDSSYQALQSSQDTYNNTLSQGEDKEDADTQKINDINDKITAENTDYQNKKTQKGEDTSQKIQDLQAKVQAQQAALSGLLTTDKQKALDAETEAIKGDTASISQTCTQQATAKWQQELTTINSKIQGGTYNVGSVNNLFKTSFGSTTGSLGQIYNVIYDYCQASQQKNDTAIQAAEDKLTETQYDNNNKILQTQQAIQQENTAITSDQSSEQQELTNLDSSHLATLKSLESQLATAVQKLQKDQTQDAAVSQQKYAAISFAQQNFVDIQGQYLQDNTQLKAIKASMGGVIPQTNQYSQTFNSNYSKLMDASALVQSTNSGTDAFDSLGCGDSTTGVLANPLVMPGTVH